VPHPNRVAVNSGCAQSPAKRCQPCISHRSWRDSSRNVATARLSPSGWDLESSGVADLLAKIRQAGVPLREYLGTSPLYGIKTGFNEAFLIDQQTRDRLVAEDPKCEPIIRKFLRGRDIQRWHPQWGGEWMIVLKSSENHPWPWANAGDKAQSIFRKTYPSLQRHMARHEERLRQRADQGRHWWELRSCDYYDRFDAPKIAYQVIGFHSRFCVDDHGHYSNDKTFFLPGRTLYIAALLNSSALWRVMWAEFPHMKDEAMAMHAFAVEALPIPEAADSQRMAAAALGQALVDLAKQHQDTNATFFGWLSMKFGTTRVTQKLETYWQLDAATLEAEVRRAGASKLTPAVRRLLAEEHMRQLAALRPVLAKIRQLEIELHHLVFDLYGLTPDDVQLLRSTAPPRDPLALVEAGVGLTD